MKSLQEYVYVYYQEKEERPRSNTFSNENQIKYNRSCDS